MWMKHRMEIWWKETALWVARSRRDFDVYYFFNNIFEHLFDPARPLLNNVQNLDSAQAQCFSTFHFHYPDYPE